MDVVIPVYNAADEAARCVESVLLHTDRSHRLVLIDDGSPDPAIAAYFAELKRRALPNVVLMRNAKNLGFPQTANRGMRLSRADVVLLNSDTLVTKGWLVALARCTASDPRIGTATPFSNNAEICSFPRFCENNVPRDGDDPERIREALFRAAVPSYPWLPTGVGFCFYIRRELIDAIGVFDPAFGRGYGEENDFCMRALTAGYRSVLCDDAYVLHVGGRSFEGQKDELGLRNTALLCARHPHYLDLVRDYIARDPVRPLRDAALTQHRILTGPARGVLHVLQTHGGGTERQVRALINESRLRYRHYLAIAVGDAWRIEETHDDGAGRNYEFRRAPDEPWPVFVGGIAATFGIDLVHLHNISQCREGVITALEGLVLPYGYTVHDLDFACPTITFLAADGMYCGGVTDATACARCLAAQPKFHEVDINAWRARHRELLGRSAFVIAPSQWAASMLARYFPRRVAEVIPHGAPSPADAGVTEAPRAPFDRPGVDAPTVAVLGAIGPDKGARRLERLVDLARTRGLKLSFVLIGYLDVKHGPWQSDDKTLTIHGRYEPVDLPALLHHYRARLVAFPSAGPESFSFTLSEAWAAGLPVIVPPFGALAERVQATDAGWLWTDAEWRSEEAMLDRIVALVAAESGVALAEAAQRARAVPLPTVVDMAERTLARYDAACAEAPVSRATAFPPARVRDALGYVPWSPPSQPPSAAAKGKDPGRLLRAARGLRRTIVGRALSRMTPASVRNAMKRRLP
ncbi:MAG: glycosyltransferase [Betaproteobacteria bacterium]